MLATSPSGGKRRNGNGRDNVQSRNVDGKIVYAKRYSRNEFRSLTKNQKDAVIEMCRGKRKTEDSGGGSKPNYGNRIKALESDLITVGNAIVASVKQATGKDVTFDNFTANPNGPKDVKSESSTKATTGAVGEFIRRKRQRTQNPRGQPW